MGRVGGKNAALPLSLYELFERACPAYLNMGMTYEQYWDGDVSAHTAYREAEKLRIRDKNFQAWLQGMYVYEAIADLAPALKAFAKGRSRPYAKEPYTLFEDDKRRKEEEEQRRKYERIKEKVSAFAEAFNAKRKEKESTENGVENDAGCVP